MTEENYVVVTTISSHRMRYVVPMSELQKMNEDSTVDPSWALDAVTMQEVKEFSQDHIGEQISDTFVMSEDEILQLFDKDNDYATGWTKEYKLAYIHNWKENPSPEEAQAFEKLRQAQFSSNQERYHDAVDRMYRESGDIYSTGMSTPGNRDYED